MPLIQDDHVVQQISPAARYPSLYHIRRILSQERQFNFIAAIDSDGVEAWLRQHKPDILLYDVNPVSDCHLATVASIKKHCPRMKVVLLLGGTSEDFLVQAIRCGIEGYISKSSTPEQ